MLNDTTNKIEFFLSHSKPACHVSHISLIDINGFNRLYDISSYSVLNDTTNKIEFFVSHS